MPNVLKSKASITIMVFQDVVYSFTMNLADFLYRT